MRVSSGEVTQCTRQWDGIQENEKLKNELIFTLGHIVLTNRQQLYNRNKNINNKRTFAIIFN
jgi:hypothetical protein